MSPTGTTGGGQVCEQFRDLAVVSCYRNNRCDSDSTSAPSRALRESTVSPEFQIIHGSRAKRLLHTLPASAGAVIIVIREEAVNVRAQSPIVAPTMDSVSRIWFRRAEAADDSLSAIVRL